MTARKNILIAFFVAIALLAWPASLEATPAAAEGGAADPSSGATTKARGFEERKIEIGDKLRIKIYPEDAFVKGADTEVSSEGNVTLPLVGKVPVVGMRPVDAEREIVKILSKDYLVNPVVVIEFVESAPERSRRSVAVLGQIQKPGTYEFPPDQKLTLLKLLSMAGGFTDIANVKKIKVIRKEGSKTRVIRANAESIISGNKPDIELEPGDVVHIGESFF